MELNQLALNNISLDVAGRKLTLSTGGFAFQADSAVIAQYGGTQILATVTRGPSKEDLGYFPLQVEYIERLYAGGKIKGSRWVKREGRGGDETVLTARLIDRAIRPLFPEGYYHEIQVVLTTLSVDQENDPDFVAMVAASAALRISDIPWNGPVGSVKVGFKDGSHFINPVEEELDYSQMNLTVAVGPKGILMLEAGSSEVKEDDYLNSIFEGAKEAKKIMEFIEDFGKKYGKEKHEYISFYPTKEQMQKIDKVVGSKLEKLLKEQDGEKVDLSEVIQEAKDALIEEIKPITIDLGVNTLFKKKVRDKILNDKRLDSRDYDQVRELSGKVNLLARTHGSAVFQRGLTQVMTVTTLGAPSLKQLIESPEGEETKRYIHHYSMPGYSVGEVGRFGWPGRREIGHGALAERALLPVIPSEDKFPYTIMVVSEVLSSNGSTSMASVCGSTLSLMDAGVPITSPVAGISIGMVSDGKNYKLLTDIAGIEDFNGDMDFKVAGTKNGITAVQVDIKLEGLSNEVVKEAFEKAKLARMQILEFMKKIIPSPRVEVSQFAPNIEMMIIEPSMIGELIGPGGRVIKKIIEETGAEISVEDDGSVCIVGVNPKAISEAKKKIEAVTHVAKVGERFSGEVKRIQNFGVFVEYLPGKDGLIHVSDLADGFVKDPASLVKIGDKIDVVIKEIDEAGRVNLKPAIPFHVSSSDTRGFQKKTFGQEHDRNITSNFSSRYSKDKKAPRK
jgi:polyribonucleotide nucleotidyltransferase